MFDIFFTFVNMLSFIEENYLKALLQLTLETGNKEDLGTNKLAASLT